MIRSVNATLVKSRIADSTSPNPPAPNPLASNPPAPRHSFGASSILQQRSMPEEEPIQPRTLRPGDDRAEDEDPIQLRTLRPGDDRAAQVNQAAAIAALRQTWTIR